MFQWNAHMLNLHVNSHTEHRQINKDTPFIPLKVLFYHKHTEVKVTQSCPTLCNPMHYTVHGTLQARILEWVAFPFPRESSQPRDQTQDSRIAGRFFTSWATRGAPKRRGKYVYLMLIHVDMWQKPSQDCKVIIQNNNNNKAVCELSVQ